MFITESDRTTLKEYPVGRLAIQVISNLEKCVTDLRYRLVIANERAQMGPGDDNSWRQVKASMIEMSVKDLLQLQRKEPPTAAVLQQLGYLATRELNRRGQL